TFVDRNSDIRFRKGDATQNHSTGEQQSLKVSNVNYSKAIDIHTDDLRRGTAIGSWQEDVAELAYARLDLYNDAVLGLIQGNTTATFDGKAFFATDHPTGPSTNPGTYSNSVGQDDLSVDVADADNPTAIEASNLVAAAFGHMQSFQDASGKP